VVAALAGQAWAQEKDVDGAKDHPLLTRLPGSYISSYEQKEFDVVESPYVSSGPDAKWEGKVTRISYSMQEGARAFSMAQIARNYEAALKKVGGVVLYSGDRVAGVKLQKGGATTYVAVEAFNDGSRYDLVIVEKGTMKEDVIADAAAMLQGIQAEGKIALYGIFFDTDKAIVKPESAPTLEQVVLLLTQHPGQKLFVVGHTDGTGGLESNVKLASDRAAAVVQALVARGIDAGRLKAAGVGPFCPVASNRTDAGRAKNRRVELVDRL
jgi:outer membrane protein OmpA-like peptidoglycan-associated protein